MPFTLNLALYLIRENSAMDTRAVIQQLTEAWYEPWGCFFLLRQGTFDYDNLSKMVNLLRSINLGNETTIDRQLASLIWIIPQFIEWQRTRVPQDKSTLISLDRMISLMQNEIERILGMP